MEKICIVYKFTNTVTGDFYIGSHNNIKKSSANHKYQSIWIVIPNDQMYQDIQKYGEDKFVFEILEVVEPEQLKEVEQQFIETLKPTYNQMNAEDLDIDKHKEYNKRIIGIYKITNTITGDFYIGSSKDVKQRLAHHKKPSIWKRCPNNPLYQDMQKYGVDKFAFEIIAETEVDKLKEKEQEFIEILKPTYNNRNAKGWNVERCKESKKEYEKSDKGKERRKEYRKNHKDELNKYQKEYRKTDKFKEHQKEYSREYTNQLCFYNGKTITLNALSARFSRKGIEHPTLEAKKYLIEKSS